MQIHPTFWAQLRRHSVEYWSDDHATRSLIEPLVEPMPALSDRERQQLMVKLFNRLGETRNAIEAALHIGTRLPITAFGPLSLGTLTASSVGQSLGFLADVSASAIPLAGCSYTETASHGHFSIGFQHALDRGGEAFVVALAATAIDREISRRSGRLGNVAELKLSPSSRGFEAAYRKHLLRTPQVDHTTNTLVFERPVLELGNPYADPDTFQSIVTAYGNLAERQIDSAPLMERAREVILRSVDAPPSQQRLARLLELSSRQLRARLEMAGTSYQALVRECRTRHACALLRNPTLSLSQIAERLGYSDPSAFSHAFYRWTGQSPSAFRDQLQPRP